MMSSKSIFSPRRLDLSCGGGGGPAEPVKNKWLKNGPARRPAGSDLVADGPEAALLLNRLIEPELELRDDDLALVQVQLIGVLVGRLVRRDLGLHLLLRVLARRLWRHACGPCEALCSTGTEEDGIDSLRTAFAAESTTYTALRDNAYVLRVGSLASAESSACVREADTEGNEREAKLKRGVRARF